MNKDFSIGETISFGWEMMKKNSIILIGYALITIVIQSFSQQGPLALLVYPLGVIFWAAIGIIALHHEDFGFSRIFSKFGFRNFLSVMAGIWTLGLICAGIIVLCLVPLYDFVHLKSLDTLTETQTIRLFASFFIGFFGVVYVMMRFSLFSFYIVDHKLTFGKALTKSWDTTSGHSAKLLLLTLVLWLINMVGALFLLVGLLVTMPITYLAWAKVYGNLKSDTMIVE